MLRRSFRFPCASIAPQQKCLSSMFLASSSSFFANMSTNSIFENSNAIVITPSSFEMSSFRFYGGFGKAERGKVRLSFEERQAKRTPKTREQKQEAEQKLLEAEQYVDTELPDICASDQEKLVKKAEQAVQKLLHPAQALFDVPVEIHGQQKPLSQLATIVKVSARDYDIVPSNHAFISPILVRIPRYDSSLNAHKVGDKIRVTMPQMTRTKRVAVADHIKDMNTKSKKHFMVLRRNAVNHIDELGINEDTANVRKEECEEIVKKSEAELAVTLDELAQSVLMAQDDEDGGADGTGAV